MDTPHPYNSYLQKDLVSYGQPRQVIKISKFKNLPQNFLSQQKLAGPILLMSLSLYKIFYIDFDRIVFLPCTDQHLHIYISLEQDSATAEEDFGSAWTAATNSSGVSETEAAGIAPPRIRVGESAKGKSG